MDDSQFRRLPPELRGKIFAYATGYNFVCKDLASRLSTKKSIPPKPAVEIPNGEKQLALREMLHPLQVCRQMREEALPLLFGHKSLALGRFPYIDAHAELVSAVIPAFGAELVRWQKVVSSIPEHLRMPHMSVEYRYHLALSKNLTLNDKLSTSPENVEEFSKTILTLAKASFPNQLFVAVHLAFQHSGITPLCAYPSERFFREPPQYICKRDPPIRDYDNEWIALMIPTSDRKQAHSVVTKTFEEKRQLFAAHRDHRVCFVRLYEAKTLERLAIAEARVHEVVDCLPVEAVRALS